MERRVLVVLMAMLFCCGVVSPGQGKEDEEVFVVGAVRDQGAYRHEVGMTVGLLIQRAGGTRPDAVEERMRIDDANKRPRRKGEKVTRETLIFPGETLVVPPKSLS